MESSSKQENSVDKEKGKDMLTESTTPEKASSEPGKDDISAIAVETTAEVKDEPSEEMHNETAEMIEPVPAAGPSNNTSISGDSKLNASFMEEDIVKTDGVFSCKKCGKTAKTKQNIRKH